MSESTFFVLALLVFLLLFGLALWGAGIAQEKTFAWATALARRHGLQVIGGELYAPGVPLLGQLRKSFTIEGTVAGTPLRVYTYSTGSGKSRTSWVAIEATVLNPQGLSFRLTREGLGSAIAKAFGAQDVETGDRVFDERYRIKASDPAFLKAALLPELRKPLLAEGIWDGSATFQLELSSLKYVEVGTLSCEATQKRIERWLPILAAWAVLPPAYRG